MGVLVEGGVGAVAQMYEKHTYSFGDEELGVFRAHFTFTNRLSPGGYPYTYLTADRTAE